MARRYLSKTSAKLSLGMFIRCWTRPPISLRRSIALARHLGLKDESDRELEAIVFREAAKSQQPLFLDTSCKLDGAEECTTLSVN